MPVRDVCISNVLCRRLKSFVVSRIALVKPSKATAVQDLLIRMAQSGQVRQKISEQQLIGLLDQIEGGASGGAGSTGSGSGSAGKITVSVLLSLIVPLLMCYKHSLPEKRHWMTMTMTLICNAFHVQNRSVYSTSILCFLLRC